MVRIEALIGWKSSFEMQVQEQLPGYGFCSLAEHAHDDEGMQDQRWVAAALPVAYVTDSGS